jgi:hypothetical protein
MTRFIVDLQEERTPALAAQAAHHIDAHPVR